MHMLMKNHADNIPFGTNARQQSGPVTGGE